MSKAADDLEAVREIATLLEPFAGPERERILRWVRERVGMPAGPAPGVPAPQSPLSELASGASEPLSQVPPAPDGGVLDIKSFIRSKNPRNETQLAATVAYYHQFVARGDDQKDAISAADVLEACRKAEWKRPSRAAQTMVNAYANGVFDKVGQGKYHLNAVGENLVAMVLPGSAESGSPKAQATAGRGRRGRKPVSRAKAKKGQRK